MPSLRQSVAQTRLGMGEAGSAARGIRDGQRSERCMDLLTSNIMSELDVAFIVEVARLGWVLAPIRWRMHLYGEWGGW